MASLARTTPVVALARPNFRAGHIGVRGLRAPNAEVHSLIILRIDPRVGDSRPRVTRARAGNLDKGASVVELGRAVVGTMKTYMLSADEILSRRRRLGDSKGDAILVVGAPGSVPDTAATASAFLVNLEPLTRAVVVLDAAAGVHETCRPEQVRGAAL